MSDDATGWGGELWAAADLLTPMAIRVAATLRLADHIVAGRRTADALAAATDADPDALARVLRHLVSAGVLSDTETGEYGLTALGEHLRDDEPGGVRALLDLDGAIGHADMCFVQLLHTVRTGQAAYPKQFGRPFWEDLAANAELAASFDGLMGSRLGADAPVIAKACPWGELGHLVDVGGGDGSLLIAILLAHEGLRGTVTDLPGAVARAREAIAAAGLGDRAEARAVSLFDPQPAAGGYLLSGVLHDWPDSDATRILSRCAEAGGTRGKVFVVEDHHGEPNTEGDLRMLTYVLGRDRSVDQLAELAAPAGLAVTSVVPVRGRSIIELSRNVVR